MSEFDTLRKTAEAATPGPWIIDSLESGEHGVFVEEGNPDYRKLGCASAIVASHLVGKNAEYLEAFDPETVLALLSRLEQAEGQLRNQTSALKTLAERNIDLTERMRVLNIRFDAMRAGRDSERSRADKNQNRLERAEQAVARVRELADAWKSRGEHDMEYSKTIPEDVGEIILEGGAEMVNKANLIHRALDGESNE